ncbi:MAG TPA: DUF4845 domain-containing protein [Pseudomonadales bacterium]
MLSSYQKGLSPFGMLAAVCLFALLLVSALKLVPHYIDFNTLKTVYQDIGKRPDTQNMSPNDIFDSISRALSINSVRGFNIADSTIISRETGQLQIGLDYEVREHLFANIDVVLTFYYMPE